MITRLLTRIALLLVAFAPLAASGADKVDSQRAGIRKVTNETLTILYRDRPSLKGTIEKAAGYAVFSNFGMKILVAGGGSGKGLAVNNKTRQETFMRMAEIQAGLGMGVKKFRIVFVFETEQAFTAFIDQGWAFGGQATAAAKTGDDGVGLQGAVSVSPGVWMYQLTDKGIAAEITAKGTKYWKDDALN